MVQTMYTIRQAAARSGVSVPTLRAWERRYGVVRPSRTTAGYRLYDDEAIARLVAMRHLVDTEGWRPSQAAERVLTASDLAPLSPPPPPAERRPDDAEGSPSTLSGLAVDALVAAVRRMDVPAMEHVLDEVFATQRFELAMDRVVFPALRTVGEAWSAGDLDVALEHVASETIRRRLAHFFDAAGRGERAPTVLVGLPPAGQHEIGAFAFAVAARRAGLEVLYLGANVPVESWLRTARKTAAPIVVLGVVTPGDVAAAIVVVDALRSMTRPPRCLIGGPLARTVAMVPDGTWLPQSLDEAVITAAQTLD